VFFVESVEHEGLGDLVGVGVLPNLIGADADAVGGVDDDEGGVAHAQGGEAFADEIEVPGVSIMLNLRSSHSQWRTEAWMEIFRSFSSWW
jgi:hypothetical protein